MITAAADRTMVLQRVIMAPVRVVWSAWWDPGSLPQWWGPDGFTCRTKRIDLTEGGDWVFDMVGPDGTVYPNHHRFTRVEAERRIDYTLYRGENGPKHAEACVTFEDHAGEDHAGEDHAGEDHAGEDHAGATNVTMSLTLATVAEYQSAVGFGAVELGMQTLGKLARAAGAA